MSRHRSNEPRRLGITSAINIVWDSSNSKRGLTVKLHAFLIVKMRQIDG